MICKKKIKIRKENYLIQKHEVYSYKVAIEGVSRYIYNMPMYNTDVYIFRNYI